MAQKVRIILSETHQIWGLFDVDCPPVVDAFPVGNPQFLPRGGVYDVLNFGIRAGRRLLFGNSPACALAAAIIDEAQAVANDSGDEARDIGKAERRTQHRRPS